MHPRDRVSFVDRHCNTKLLPCFAFCISSMSMDSDFFPVVYTQLDYFYTGRTQSVPIYTLRIYQNSSSILKLPRTNLFLNPERKKHFMLLVLVKD